jgi:LytS/YehU family sensor histidine kinase
VALSGKPEIVPDTTTDPRYIIDDEARLSEICVPIVYQGRVLGVIDCEHPERRFFNQQHLKILTAIASICAMKISWLRVQRRMEEKQQRLLEARQDMAELKIKAIRAQMNPHFIFNALNAIQHFITENDKKSSLTYLSLFSKLIRYYLSIIDQEHHSLESEIKMLRWYLELQSLRYENRLKWTLQAPEPLPVVSIPTLIVQLMVEDILENMVMENMNTSEIFLNFEVHTEEVEVEVSVKVDDASHLKKRTDTYRQGQTPWFEQMIILNRIKRYGIKRKFDTLPLSDVGQIFKWTLHLPKLV